MNRVLIVDDDVAVTNYFTVFLMQTERYDSVVLNDSREALGLLAKERFDAILLDMDMPHVNGLDILQTVYDQKLAVPVIVLTGVGDVDIAVKAMKLGAFDYLTKPVDDDTLLKVLDDAIQHKTIKHSISQLPAQLRREDLAHGEAFPYFPTQDPSVIRFYHEAEKMADGDSCIFIWGERGTYKELLARAIHNASPRKAGPFVAVDVAAREPGRFPAEFFGQAKDWSGAREETPGLLEQAAGGTLFIDEIDLLSIPMQVRLKKLIQAGEFYRENSTKLIPAHVRFVAASHHDLTQDYYKDAFSRDLLYHLMLHSLRIPALHECREDIPLLAAYFLKEDAARVHKHIPKISPEFIDFLMRYDFPDNVRELRNIIAMAVSEEKGDALCLESLPQHVRDLMAQSREKKAKAFSPRSLAEVEREHVAKTLLYFNNDKAKAAEALRMSVESVESILSGPVKGG